MKRILNTAIFLVVIAATLFGQDTKTKHYDLTNYDEIEVSNSLNVKVVQNGKEGITVKCDSKLLPAILVDKIGNKIKIGIDWDEIEEICGTSFFSNRSISVHKNYVKINGKVFEGKIEIVAYFKNISKLKAASSGDILVDSDLQSDDLQVITSSSGDILMKGNLKADNLEFTASSSGDIVCNGLSNSNKLKLQSSSSGDIEVNCKTVSAIINLSSSGDFDGNVDANNIKVSISSSAEYKGIMNAEEAKFDLHSSGSARVSGNIDNLYVDASSSGDFYGKKVVYKYAELQTSSGANIYLSKSGKVVDNTPRRTGVFIE